MIIFLGRPAGTQSGAVSYGGLFGLAKTVIDFIIDLV
jgi:hypothetical protein